MRQSNTWWIRLFLISSAIRGLILGIKGFVTPAEMPIPLHLTPLNASFVAALYLAGTIGLILTIFARNRADTRAFLVGTGVVTSLLLITTLLRWPEFDTTLSVPLVAWLGSYIFDPIAITLLVATHGLALAANPGRHRLTTLFLVEAGVLGGIGLLLLALPDVAAAVWPWKIAPMLAQLYSCFFIAFAAIAWLLAYDQRPIAVRNFAASSLSLMAAILSASLLYQGRFLAGPASWIWFGGLLLGVGAFATALVSRDPSPQLAVPVAPRSVMGGRDAI